MCWLELLHMHTTHTYMNKGWIFPTLHCHRGGVWRDCGDAPSSRGYSRSAGQGGGLLLWFNFVNLSVVVCYFAVLIHDELSNEFWLTWFFSCETSHFQPLKPQYCQMGLLNSTKHCYCIYTQRDFPHSRDYNFYASFVSMFHHVHISHIVSALIEKPSLGYTHIFHYLYGYYFPIHTVSFALYGNMFVTWLFFNAEVIHKFVLRTFTFRVLTWIHEIVLSAVDVMYSHLIP